MSDKLDALIVKEGKPDFDLLGEILQPYVRLGQDGSILFEKNYGVLPQWGKVLVYLLARKALISKNLTKESEGQSPKEICDKTYVPRKSITSILVSELKGIVANKKGRYNIPNYNLYRCKDALQKLARNSNQR